MIASTLKFVGKSFSSITKSIKQNPKQALVLVILLIALWSIWKVKDDNKELTQQNVVLVSEKTRLEQEKAQLKLDIAVAVATNQANQVVIDKLSLVAEDSEERVAQLQKSHAKLETKYNSVLTFISKSTPEQDGPVAPVLEHTIRQLQQGTIQ